MKTLITRIKRLALALCFVTPLVSWAGLPTITVSGNDVTISNDSGSHGNIGTNNGGYDTLTIPATTDLDSGTVLRIKAISFGPRTSGTAAPEIITLAGVDSAAAQVTASGYTDRDKYTYVFETPCLMKVGTGSTISFKNASGNQVNVGLAASLTGSTAQDDYLFTTLKSTSGNNKWSLLTEIVAEKVTGYINATADGFNTTITSEKVYVSGVTGYWNTPNGLFGTVDELVVVDGAYQFGHKIVNGNSPNASYPNRGTAFKKLSGTGTITNGDHSNGPTPVIGVCDTSEFAGSINIGTSSTRPTILFCTEDEISAGIETSLGATLQSLFTSETGRSRIYVSSGRTTANNAVVTVPTGKTWTAVNGIENKGELVVNGTVSCKIVNSGKLTINGTVTGMISGSGTVVVNEGATVSSISSQRDFTGWTIDSSIPVKITMTAEEYGKGSVSVTGANEISSITVLAPDGTTEVGTITPEEGAGTLETGVKTSGLATWCDYEFNGDKSNSGVDTTGLTSDVNTTTYPEIFNSSMLYTYTHPWRNINYPNSWTAVVRCTVPELENAVVVMFGTYSAGAIGLVAGSNPEEQMLLVSTPGSTATTSEAKHFTTLAAMNVKDATTAQHVYVFTKDGTTVNVYCDGEKVLDNYELASATLGGGLQVGSLHGGVVQNNVHTGLVRFGAGEDQISSLTLAQQQNARIDCMRMFDYIVSPEQIAALSVEFPAVKLYRATVAENAETSWTDLSWTPAWDGGNTQSKAILTTEGGATVALPASITVDEVQLVLAEGSTLTLSGPGSLAVTQPITIEDGTLELTGTVTFTQDTAFNGSVVFNQFTKAGDGAIKLSNGATVGVDAALVVTPLGTYTCAEGTVADAAYSSGEGDVKLIPLTDAVVSITQGETTLYYSDLDTALGPLVNAPGSISEDVQVTLLNGTTLPFGYDTYLLTAGYYIDGNVITKAVAQIGSTTYPTLAAAVGAAADGAKVVLRRASSEVITLDKAITLSETANFSGTLTGNGTLTFEAFRNNPSITFDNWTGTVVLPSFAADGTKLNNYGVAGSTVVLKGITGGWFTETSTQKMDVAPVLQLDGNVTIKGFSTSWDYTFAELAGTGNFVLDPTDNNPKSATITKVAEDFSGIITNNTDKVLTITTLAREAETSTDVGTKLLDIGGTGEIVVGAVTIGGEPADVYLVYEEDGVYVGVPPVEINPSAVVINYNSYATLSVVGGSLEGATYGWTMYTNGVACSSTSGPVKISSGKTKATVKVYSEITAFDNVVAKVAITNGEDVIEREATITVADVAAKIGETEYTKAQLDNAIADAISSGEVLEHYLGVSTTISKGQTLKTKKLAERNGSASVKAAASTTAGEAWTIAKSEADGVITWSVGTETPYFEFTSEDGETVEYLAAPKNAAGTNKLLSDTTITKQFSVTKAGVVLDLNGHALTSTYASTSAGAVYVNVIVPAPAALTVKDSVGGGSIAAASAHSVFMLGNNGQLTVEGGSFTGKHIVYGSKTTSVATITGGTFTATDAGFTLNMLDSARGTITVTGGTFTGFNPANNAAEGAGTNFVPNGYAATETSTGVWTVAKSGIDPTDPTSTQEVTPTAEEIEAAGSAEAAAIAAATVTVPDGVSGVDAPTYKAYFTYSATPTATAGTYAVAITGFADVVTETADGNALAALEAATAGGTLSAEVAVKPGLYYGTASGADVTTLKASAGTLNTTGKLDLSGVTKPSTGEAFFIKIKVGTTAFAAEE